MYSSLLFLPFALFKFFLNTVIRLHNIDKKSGSLSQKELCRDLKHVYDLYWLYFCHAVTSVMSDSLQHLPHNPGPMDCSPPGSSVHGILQARILEWVAIPSSRESSWCRDWTLISYSPALADEFLTTSASRKAYLCHIGI